MRHWTRRVATTAVAVGTTLTLGANAAFAHYCAKTNFNEQAHANVTERAQAWMGADDFLAMLSASVGEQGFPPCFDLDGALAVFEAFFAEHDDWAFKGPGLLAGGSLTSGNLPDGFSHELGEVFDDAIGVGFLTCDDEGGPA